MRKRLDEAYFLTMAKWFGSIILILVIVVAAVGIWNGPPPGVPVETGTAK